MNETLGEMDSIGLYALDHGPWLEVQASLRRALEGRRLGLLVAPTTRIVHDLLDSALKAMQLQVFRNIMETELGLRLEDKDEQLQALFKLELSEHGAKNIAGACQSGGWQVSVSFSSGSDVHELVRIEVPCAWERSDCQTERLIDALGFRLDVDTLETGCRITLRKRADRRLAPTLPGLLTGGMQSASMAGIFDKLSYGLIQFSEVGEILAVSPALLRRLGLDEHESSVFTLAEAIPLSFYNDIIWGQALAEGDGLFENYRIRVRLSDSTSILFNVSGFRQPDGSVHSLWQAVSQEKGGAKLTEGSMISEVRIHNITRNYVPQLVEKKAREAVRLGKSSLSNEERPVAVLFCDIVGFTSYVELNADSESIIDTLNSILRRVSRSVRINNGSIDKFMGDCVMALFDDPSDAVLSAIDMQSHAEDINSLRSRAGQQTLGLRIGIHWGNVVIGNVGTDERLDWTAIGDVVNIASRIEKGCKPGAILVSKAVRDSVESKQSERFNFGELFGLQVKGKRDALVVCQIETSGSVGEDSKNKGA